MDRQSKKTTKDPSKAKNQKHWLLSKAITKGISHRKGKGLVLPLVAVVGLAVVHRLLKWQMELFSLPTRLIELLC